MLKMCLDQISLHRHYYKKGRKIQKKNKVNLDQICKNLDYSTIVYYILTLHIIFQSHQGHDPLFWIGFIPVWFTGSMGFHVHGFRLWSLNYFGEFSVEPLVRNMFVPVYGPVLQIFTSHHKKPLGVLF